MNTENKEEIHETKTINTREEEIETFFRSVTMKVKNANFQPVDLVDLQIEILQVISNKLRNSVQGNTTINIQYST